MVKKIIIKVIVLLFIFMILLIGCVSDTSPLMKRAKIDNNDIQSEMSKYIDDYSPKDKFSGTVIVAKDNEIILDEGYGMADYNNKIMNKSKTVFDIASITKQFTATAILMLQEKNLLSVQDTVDKYIPDYPEGKKIKIYNLLSQTSGIIDYSQPSEKGKLTYTPLEIIELFKNEPRKFETGTKYEYSSSNYILLGYIIEKVSGMKYEQYLEKNIFKPLKLNSTGFLSNKLSIKNKAIGYALSENSGKYIPASNEENSTLYSAGGIYSTVNDLYTWENALFEGELISKESLYEMLTPLLNTYGYGYGLIISKNAMEDKMVWHNGTLSGYSSYIGKNINKDYVFIILSNKGSYNVVQMVSGLTDILEVEK
ncbi:beta-lactamase family protein [Clostridium estertheticum]|uniref:serine hydrolase domain-containing protein n=1 Tax=Clostridium estertheticum TaxID=238834 RepID=UPI001CF3466C|nr:serine hydrolase domain-containing protein [Clostridium estertheticum]MCB2309089.1 beta-lactamase family protein [Clostridium estertheticum]MCB2352055.1 beta-lactamase family protein [Clostridium estertheticum]WAG45383.1 beta-lactamase family protein [Clostridium estertheticum]